ncbi:LysR family transcriptional regulator [Streptomyces glaucosporus]|uniref:LysR family transcriptional regulator n=1 Tax=Streptomyces glaucosporus TaxID=284044 RepID=A0ABP5W0Y1_9ACTN
MFEVRHLRVLRAVARTGSFSAAARELGCTQPAVSQQMRALEQAAGTPLLVRTGRETRPTEAGEALVRHAAGILAALAAAEEEVAAIAGLRAGRVRLASFPSASAALVPAAVAALREEYPGARVSLVEAGPPRSAEMVGEGECEIALVYRHTGSGAPAADGAFGDPGDGLVVRPLLTERFVGLLPEDHHLARAESVDLGELAEESWIAGCRRCRGHLVRICESAGFAPRIDFTADGSPAVAGLVGAGLGVAVLPESAIGPVRPEGVRTVRITPEAGREVAALTLPDLVRVPVVAAMLDRLSAAARG